jgi:predicted kinase
MKSIFDYHDENPSEEGDIRVGALKEEPICYVMVGLPATGKSTRVREMCAMDLDAFVYSTDNFIEDAANHLGITYNEAFEDNIKAATASMNEMLDVAIQYKQNIIWDQTNLGVKKRAKIINRMRQAGYTVNCECVVPPAGDSQNEDWLFRLHNRPGKNIPDHIMKNMMDTYAIPTEDEGFDSIEYYDMYRNIQPLT